MALNSNIRNISLLGNCDLTNFHADIHDYEGFEKDNSLFLNKRKVNWWTREGNENEFAGLHAIVNGANFDIYRGTSKLGSISRDYYKLESVSASAYLEETLSSCVNPYPQDNNWALLFKKGSYSLSAKPFESTVRACGNKIIEWDGTKVNLYDENGQRIAFFNNLKAYDLNNNEYTPTYVDFVYAETALQYYISGLTLTIPAGHVYICCKNGKAGGGYDLDLSTNTIGYVQFTQDSGVARVEEFFNPDARGAFGKVFRAGDRITSQLGCFYSIIAFNGNLYIQACLFGGSLTANWIDYSFIKNTTTLWTESGGFGALEDGQNVYIELSDLTTGETCSASIKGYVSSTLKHTETVIPENVYQVNNYSKKYGPWAVNFINNVAQNIAHDFKKLFILEGNESNGTLTDIDGYNDDYIYFHYGEKYYRISIERAENIKDMVKNFNGIYVLFNTTSYLNALYLNNDTWFCSCDDWNDRVQWGAISNEKEDMDSTSRLNDKWQTLNSIVSVSTQYYLVKRKIPVTCTQVEAYDASATWDGSSVVYDSSCNAVDTSTWGIGHSLSGYYYGTEFTSNPALIAPIYVDTNYTCPVYTDQDGAEQKQSYTVYFQKLLELNTPQSSVKQGTLNADGFTVSLDEGDIYSDPPSSYQQQETPCLLDANYIVYDSSVIVITPESAFSLMRNPLMGLWFFVYLTATDVPISQGDTAFVINGIEYTYKAESNQILDYTGLWVANTNLLIYMGFTSSKAYFYSTFDKCVYAFKGDNSFEKLISLEKYQPAYISENDKTTLDTLYLSSIDLFFVNLSTAILCFYDNQYVVLETGTVNEWDLDYNSSCLTVNNKLYSVIRSSLAINNVENYPITQVPINVETQFYGNTDSESNSINDCVYLTVDNLQSLSKGNVKIQAIGLQNQKLLRSEEKIVSLKQEDFNELSQCMIKYQPCLQECKGLKIKISSDFEIADLKIGTSIGAMNQTSKRI